MIKVYVAGPIRNSSPIQFLQNVKNGIQAAAILIREGYAPFCPHLDYQYFLQWADSDVPDLSQLIAISVEWLYQCDAMFVLPGWINSEGVREELSIAHLAEIPIVFSLSELNTYFKTNHERRDL